MQQMTQTHDLERAAAQREHEKALQQQQTALEMLQGHMQVGAVGVVLPATDRGANGMGLTEG